jgi:hypothetical protein
MHLAMQFTNVYIFLENMPTAAMDWNLQRCTIAVWRKYRHNNTFFPIIEQNLSFLIYDQLSLCFFLFYIVAAVQ